MSGLSDASSIDGHDNDQSVSEWDGVSDWDEAQGAHDNHRRMSGGLTLEEEVNILTSAFKLPRAHTCMYSLPPAPPPPSPPSPPSPLPPPAAFKVFNSNNASSVRFSDLAAIDHPHSRRVQKMKCRALDEGFVDEAVSPGASRTSTLSQRRLSGVSNVALPGSPSIHRMHSGAYTPRTSRRLSLHEQRYAYTPTGKLLRGN